MKELMGSPGTVSGLVLRLGQCLFSAVSIGVMSSARGFSTFTAFCYLIASMGIQLLWSFGLACLDVYAMKRKRDLRNPVLVTLFVVGDWVTATLSLGAACSSTGIVVLYARDQNFCKRDDSIPCRKYELSILMAFSTSLLIGISSHVMLWILAYSVDEFVPSVKTQPFDLNSWLRFHDKLTVALNTTAAVHLTPMLEMGLCRHLLSG